MTKSQTLDDVLRREEESARELAANELDVLVESAKAMAKAIRSGYSPTGASQIIGQSRDAALAVERVRAAMAKSEGVELARKYG